MKHDQVVTPIPTIGFNVGIVEFNNLFLNVWDVGSQDKTRLLWRLEFADTAVCSAAPECSCVDVGPEDWPLDVDIIKWLKDRWESRSDSTRRKGSTDHWRSGGFPV